MAELDVDRFLTRLGKLHSHMIKNRSSWNSADCFLLHRGISTDEDHYRKSVVLHHWLFGYELPDTILALDSSGNVTVLSSKKKCEFLQPAADRLSSETNGGIQGLQLLVRNKEDENAQNYQTLLDQIITDESTKIGSILKERPDNLEAGGILGPWETKLDQVLQQDDSKSWVDVAVGLSLVLAPKDASEQDLLKKSSVLSNKVMKHGFVKKMEEVIDAEQSITHEELATHVDAILEDPSLISLKGVPKEDVQPCYFPIIQSGGNYDLKISAQSTTDPLSHDIITVSLGARYKLYCSNIARTFLVDPPKQVSDTYEILQELQEVCLQAMKPGAQLKEVYKAAATHLKNKQATHLVDKLPKNLGFAMGMDFRDPALLLSPKNPIIFRAGMVFCLSVGFQDVELSEQDRAATPSNSAVKNLSKYSLLIADTVFITAKSADVMTKMGKSIADVAYNINDNDDDDDDGEESDENVPNAPRGDAELARKLATRGDRDGPRQSARLAKDAVSQVEAQEGAAKRERQQIALMARRNEERLRELARDSLRNKGKNADDDQAEEMQAYKSTRDYPDDIQPNQVKVDMARQCVILPIGGNPVPFHISTIKNVVVPDADNATLLRINFYTAGMAVGKDAPVNMAKLVAKYAPYASFIREMTFRSLDGHNLNLAFRQISELRKRARTKELREIEEANLVEQEKLIRTKNERVPRLSDLTMRPVFAGRKTQGNLEAHTNGLRFISTRVETVDIMYNNIKYAIFQPCETEIMVLIHFHLKNPIMVGKKKHRDVQFFTEVVDASQTVDAGRRSMYDPDEMDDEQRERQLRKRLNGAFKDFCKKVDAVSKKNGYHLEFDIPYRDLGFDGNPHKEMVRILPTLNCLVNLTETPFFVVDLEDLDHVHFERVTYMSKAFDMVMINKDFSKQPWRIDMIANSDKDSIQEWLTDMEITYTEGPMNLNWKQIMKTVADDDRFYMNTEEDEVTEKEAGWEFLRLYGREDEDDEDEDEDDSEFGGNEESAAESEEEEESNFDSEEEEESDFDADEELEEQGMDWEEMEAEAAADDRRKRQRGEDEEPARRPSGRSRERPAGGRRGSKPPSRPSGGRRGVAPPIQKRRRR